MAADTDRLEIDIEDIQTAQEIVGNMSNLKPLTSLSFTLSVEGLNAVKETLRLIEWGIGKNKPKLKQAALDVMSPLAGSDPGVPNNINLTEFEIKAIEEVLAVIERALSKYKDGMVTR
jgi:hypothetical protein